MSLYLCMCICVYVSICVSIDSTYLHVCLCVYDAGVYQQKVSKVYYMDKVDMWVVICVKMTWCPWLRNMEFVFLDLGHM